MKEINNKIKRCLDTNTYSVILRSISSLRDALDQLEEDAKNLPTELGYEPTRMLKYEDDSPLEQDLLDGIKKLEEGLSELQSAQYSAYKVCGAISDINDAFWAVEDFNRLDHERADSNGDPTKLFDHPGLKYYPGYVSQHSSIEESTHLDEIFDRILQESNN